MLICPMKITISNYSMRKSLYACNSKHICKGHVGTPHTDIFAEYLFYVLAKQNAKFHDNLMPTFLPTHAN